jgi:hypothetical protein
VGIAYNTNFETESALGEVFDSAVGTTASIDTAHAKDGTKALLIHQTGTASASKKTLPAGTRNHTARIWFWFSINPTATWQIYTLVQASANAVLRITTSGAIQCGFNGGTFQGATTAATGAWHSADLKFSVDGPTFTADWTLDGVPQTQATLASTPADFTLAQFGTTGATTIDCWVDQWAYSHSLTDYPLQDVSTTYTVTFPALGAAPQVVVPVAIGVPRTKERAVALARTYLHTLADQSLAASTLSGSATSLTVTFPALGQAPQVAVPVTASSRHRAFGLARKALHTSAEQPSPTVA